MLFNKKLIGIWIVSLIFIGILISFQNSIGPSTDYITIIDQSPDYDEVDVPLDANITITFNMAINASTFPEAFSV